MSYIAGIMLVLIGCTASMISDLFIRTRSIEGVDPDSWDNLCTLLAGLGLAIIVLAFIKELFK